VRSIESVVRRVRAEYLEMPGLRLTVGQVQRLCGIEPVLCRAVLASLVESKFLGVNPDGTYGRLAAGETARRRRSR
jgi:hypothetical protein